MKKIITFLLLVFACTISSIAQSSNFTEHPLNAQFITADVERFWKAFDEMDKTDKNPFEDYLKNASEGLSPLVHYFDSKMLYQTVIERKADYLKSRNVLDELSGKEKKIKAVYAAMKYWYPEATFPPIYFAVGMFSSGGTVTENGLLIGTELLADLNGLTGLAAHELIHFQQNIQGEDNLLKQTLIEGSADFIGELISGDHINMIAFKYGNKNADKLAKEFVGIMKNTDYTDWLYGTSGKDNRPSDLGYWMGYKISEAYFEKQKDKQQAVHDILNIKAPFDFLKESGYLSKYIQE